MRAGLFSSLSPEISEMTFKDYALRGYDETSGILESDWYNAQVELLRLSSETWGNGLSQIEEGDFSLMRWYEYTLTLEPGQTLKNAVTAPLYPAMMRAIHRASIRIPICFPRQKPGRGSENRKLW